MPLTNPNSVPDLAAPLNGEALYVVYPDYPINTDSWYGYTSLVGHAGALLIAADGLMKYVEFGRYPPGVAGRVRKVPVPNVVIDGNGKATPDSLTGAVKSGRVLGQGHAHPCGLFPQRRFPEDGGGRDDRAGNLRHLIE